MMNKRLIRAVIYVCFIPGLTLLVGAFCLFQQKLNFIEKANIVYGTVIESIPLAGNKNGSLYYPHVSFVTKSGKQIDFTSNVGTSLPSYIEGSSVKVLYDPTNPNKAEIDGIYGYMVDPVLLGSLGVFFLLIGLGAILNEYQKSRKTD
ncbi:DUF3592 domain-containing protein [Flavobacterium collinsii]|uniref:DUF3592 domain-containing protein n=1 Tax=Flavobacterium collinsii TaxID=1114861 RepID=A0ABM8KMH1_9FLAO|nr:DUF3592 domain-containing protein [Flavobacterium collinsii]CAA9201263.1 hypothetical protein FLACOL7796_03671 [Flavobacterium collinsii]